VPQNHRKQAVKYIVYPKSRFCQFPWATAFICKQSYVVIDVKRAIEVIQQTVTISVKANDVNSMCGL